MAILPDKLVELVRNGGSISIDANDYLPDALTPVAQAMSARVTLIVRHAEQWSPDVCLHLTRATAGGTILFEF